LIDEKKSRTGERPLRIPVEVIYDIEKKDKKGVFPILTFLPL
jgi:hypothetical protein